MEFKIGDRVLHMAEPREHEINWGYIDSIQGEYARLWNNYKKVTEFRFNWSARLADCVHLHGCDQRHGSSRWNELQEPPLPSSQLPNGY